VVARATTTQLSLTVTDTERWRTPNSDPGIRGRGVPFMRALMDSVQIVPSAHGTTVTMTKELGD
jgi:anti-sigma regulatory factor (Ser/Thr protein kinase)